MAVWSLMAAGAKAQSPSELTAGLRTARSRLQAMSHGYYPAGQWQQVFGELEMIEQQAIDVNAIDTAVQANMLRARALSDMQGAHDKAVALLRHTRDTYNRFSPDVMRKVYMLEAEIYAKQGNEAAIGKLIKAFRRSPYYDGQTYSYSGGHGRKTPLEVIRPHARGADSITVTAMHKALENARLAPGHLCPPFQAYDTAGAPVSIKDYTGKVVLLDFWLSKWKPWVRNLPQQVETYRTCHPYGFEILGFCLDPKKNSAQTVLNQYQADWPQLNPARGMTADFGVFGEARNFLIDRNGVIIARDLSGSDLAASVRSALGLEKDR
jgi:peroxiredoxin